MRSYKSLIVKSLLCTSLVLSANFASAAFMKDWMKPFQGPGQNISLLVVTGNYSKARLLAELIQSYNAQPILLIPYVGGNSGNDIFFVPPKKSGKALRVPYTEMTNFINFANPKMVLVLGGPEYVPDIYFSRIQDNRTIVRLTGKDWVKTADSAGKLLNLTNLGSDYRKLLAQLNSDTNYERAVAQPQQPVVEQVPTVVDIAPVVEEKPVVAAPVVEAAPQPKVIDASQK